MVINFMTVPMAIFTRTFLGVQHALQHTVNLARCVISHPYLVNEHTKGQK